MRQPPPPDSPPDISPCGQRPHPPGVPTPTPDRSLLGAIPLCTGVWLLSEALLTPRAPVLVLSPCVPLLPSRPPPSVAHTLLTPPIDFRLDCSRRKVKARSKKRRGRDLRHRLGSPEADAEISLGCTMFSWNLWKEGRKEEPDRTGEAVGLRCGSYRSLVSAKGAADRGCPSAPCVCLHFPAPSGQGICTPQEESDLRGQTLKDPPASLPAG